MDILGSLRQAPGAELYRLYLAIGKMLEDPRRILEIRQRLHLGMAATTLATIRLGRGYKAPSLNCARHRQWFKTAQLDADGACYTQRSLQTPRVAPSTSNRHHHRERNVKSSSSVAQSALSIST